MQVYGSRHSKVDLDAQGITKTGNQYWNLTTEQLYEEAIRRGEGSLAKDGPLVVKTGKHTGRSANDKFTVRDETTEDTVWWGDVNRPMTPENFDRIYTAFQDHMKDKELFIQDLWGGSDPTHRIAVRTVGEYAWHSLFCRTMLIEPEAGEMADMAPQFTIINLPSFRADPETMGCRSETIIAVNFSKGLVLIGGTEYAGENKKSVFSILNYLLPPKGVMPMHCSANIGPDGDVAIFFGLSGTGKTTLSADSSRTLIGDDEHGWSDDSVFNFEGGCYAKLINLSAEAEPEIYATTHMFGTVVENVVMDEATRELDLFDNSLAENTRAAYPLTSIPNTSEENRGGKPTNIIMLTADAFGVLPPISRLSPEQAMYHFLSGYTAKVAGTEIGVKEPQATFSACFGGPFMPRHPAVYGDLLRKKIAEGNVRCWLVNTGWTGGEYGTGHRMPIKQTRAMLHAALDGSLNDVSMRVDERFGFEVPTAIAGVDSAILTPRETWADKDAYDAKADHLAGLFVANFEKFESHVDDSVKATAPKKLG
ncbi:phosphoenolpyruvate carboxykinase [ATP] [Kordiimonas sediminis]|uniref:Phosphoenolpyruvate carboxykinase (ATP) n=1 Tax=Kordiimonas sediminis TaxID=1735581 RepID=A0A919E5Q5_9PROT|nr:phosphoenolpyruvate carboxykinase [Kordiimonas sediminis]GHF16618.1 phosphoenolpyruvate carboxykinase [ATP] [Kordiimonas sediminis]